MAKLPHKVVVFETGDPPGVVFAAFTSPGDAYSYAKELAARPWRDYRFPITFTVEHRGKVQFRDVKVKP